MADEPIPELEQTVELFEQLAEGVARKIVGGFLLKIVLQLEQWQDPTVQKVKAAIIMVLQEEFFDPKAPGGIRID